MGLIYVFAGIFLASFVAYIVILLIVQSFKYSKFLNHIEDVNPDLLEDLGVNSASNIGTLSLPIPITLRTKNKDTKRLIESHYRIVKLFWLSLLLGVLIIGLAILVDNFIL